MEMDRISLDALRRRIDEIDDTIDDLLVRRTGVVKDIRNLKGDGARTYLCPAREAIILRRLVRRHRGEFPKAVLVRLWREIISTQVRLQGPLSVAVFAPDEYPGYWDLARDHYGGFTPMTGHSTVGPVLRAVHEGAATIGIVPWPHEIHPDPWWQHLISKDPKTPRVVARLPFAGRGNSRGEDTQALAVALLPQEETGQDRSLLAIEAGGEVSRTRLKSTLTKVGLSATFFASSQPDSAAGPWLHLVEVDEFVPPDDDRLQRLLEETEEPLQQVVQVGGYAVPLTEEELAGPAGT